MKKYYNTLGLLILVVLGCVGQVQISDVQNISLIDNSNRRFINTPNKLLLVEMLPSQTHIFEVGEGGATKIQNWKFDPLDEDRVYISDGLNNLNLCFLQGDTLYEVYTRSVNATSLNTGKLLARFEFPDSIHRITNVEPTIKDGDWIISSTDKNFKNHIGLFKKDSIKYYDRQIIDGFRVGDNIFKLQNSSLLVENILTGDVILNFPNEVTKYNTSSNKTESFIWISLSNNRHYYIDSIHGTREITCNIPAQTSSMYWSDSLLFFNIQSSPSFTYQVVNTNTCQIESSGLSQGYMNFFPLKTPAQNFVCYTVFGSPNSDGAHFKYNNIQKKWDKLSIKGDDCYAMTQQFVTDRIFMLGIDRIELYAHVAGFFEIDLNNSFIVNHKFYDQSDDAFPVHFAVHPNSNLIYITTRSIKGKSDLWVQKEKAKAPVKIGNFLTEKNSGISYVISQFKYNDKIYYSTPNGIFAVDETNNTFLTDAINCSPFVQKDNFIYALIQRMDNVYGSIKINTENQQVIFKSFPGSPNLVRSFVIENKAIVAGDNLDGGYFDLGDEKFKKFKLNGNEIQTFNIAVSGNNVLFHGFIDGQREFYFWNANTNELKIIPGYGNLFPHVLPDYEGGFFLLPGNAGFGNKIKKMNVLGEIKDLTTVGPGPWYYYIAENGLTGDVHTFPFPGVNEVIFHSEKNGKINVVNVPFENTLYYENFYWQESEETVVVETFINNNYHTWVWKFDEQPYNLTPNGRADRLVSAMIQGDTVILVYFDKEQKRTIFSVYNTINKTLWENASLESYYQSPIKPITSFLFDQSGTFYFSINTTNFGEEMWSYGLKDHSLMLVNDFLPGSISGNPDNLINFNDNVLFTANATDGSRQWFKIRQSIGTSDEGEDHNNSFLFPNPTNDAVFIKKKSKHLLIYDLTGRIRYSGKQLQEGEKIDLSGFEPGLYMVTITTEQGGHAVSKLVVGR